jgi:hypothetical protein
VASLATLLGGCGSWEEDGVHEGACSGWQTVEVAVQQHSPVAQACMGTAGWCEPESGRGPSRAAGRWRVLQGWVFLDHMLSITQV